MSLTRVIELCTYSNKYSCKIFNFSYIHTETSTPTEMPSPFIDELDESPTVFAEEDSTKELVWKIIDCNWQVRVITENYTLYPNLIPELVPIKIIADYNVTAKCVENHIIVNFSISFNENVLDNNIEYVSCKIYRSNNAASIIERRVNFTSSTPLPLTINTDATDTTVQDVESSTIIHMIPVTVTITGSGCRLSVHFMTLNLALILANFLSFQWISVL